MKIQKGDIIFLNNGKPGVVTGRDQDQRILVKNQGEDYEKARNLGIINGMTETERALFENVVAKVKQQDDPIKGLREIDTAIAELEKDPKNFHLVKYLGGEKAHLIHSKGVHPKEFSIDEYEIY